MRLPRVLEDAEARRCRAILLLSSDSTANFEAALQARLLNPTAEIVVRSASDQASLGALLEQRLPGMAVVDPILLCAEAITTALRPGNGPQALQVDGQTFLLREGPWRHRLLEKPIRLPVAAENGTPVLLAPRSLAGRHAGRMRLPSGGETPPPGPGAALLARSRALWRSLRAAGRRSGWRSRSRMQQLAALALVGVLLLGIQIFARFRGWREGLFVTLGLLKGEYVDPVNVLLAGGAAGAPEASAPLLLVTLAYSLVGTLITSAIVAVILEQLLRERLGRRDRNPILLVDGDALAREVASRLHREGHPVVRVQKGGFADGEDPCSVPAQDLDAAIRTLAAHAVAAIGVLSADLLTNLREALMLQQRWPDARLVTLAHAFGADEQLGALLGGMAVISTVELVADAVVATAFGERVEGVVRLRGLNLLVVRYRIEAGDSLCGLSISRAENGYGLTSVCLRRSQHPDPLVLPPADRVLAAGDQLVVLATPDVLRSVELGRISKPHHRLRLRAPTGLSGERRFEMQQSLARWIGCIPGEVLGLLDGAEHLTPPLDSEISTLLQEELRRQGVECTCEQEPGAALR